MAPNSDLEAFLKLASANFQTERVPQTFFWSECSDSLETEFPQELRKRIAYRRWPDVKLMDWLMIGVPPCIARSYMEPSTFLYYLPSLLVGAFDDLDYLDWALEGILPFNKTHTPRGKWWAAFSSCVSDSQRIALRSFLSSIRSSNPSNLRDQALLGDADAIWGL